MALEFLANLDLSPDEKAKLASLAAPAAVLSMRLAAPEAFDGLLGRERAEEIAGKSIDTRRKATSSVSRASAAVSSGGRFRHTAHAPAVAQIRYPRARSDLRGASSDQRIEFAVSGADETKGRTGRSAELSLRIQVILPELRTMLSCFRARKHAR